MVEEIPVRVGASPQIDVDHRGVWSVNEQGGYPTAWIENQGNDIAMMTVDLDGLPEGWSTGQGTQVILAPGEVAGIPMNLVPASDWNKQRILLTINVNHPLLGVESHSIEVEYSAVSFTSSPVVDAFAGTDQTVGFIEVAGDVVEFEGQLTVSMSDDSVGFTQPSATGEYVLSWSTENENGSLSVYAVARQYPDSSITCEFLAGAFDDLGRTTVAGSVATCDLAAGETETLRAVFTLVNSIGNRIQLTEETFVISAGQQQTVNISLEGWNPEPGLFDVKLTGHDQYGRNLLETETSVVAREQGWNVGISSLSSDGDIYIGIKRSGYELLEDAVCELLVEADGGWSTTYIVDIAYAEYAPVIQIKDPGSIERDEKITATLSCSVPFDTDDNPEDDSMSTYYKPENVLAVSSNDVGWIVGVAVLILALSWLTGVVQVGKKQQQPQPTQRKPAKDTKQHEAAEVSEPTSEERNRMTSTLRSYLNQRQQPLMKRSPLWKPRWWKCSRKKRAHPCQRTPRQVAVLPTFAKSWVEMKWLNVKDPSRTA